MDELTIDEFTAELGREGVRCILQVRHAERPKMDPDDPTFGDALPITEEGLRTSHELGRRLAAFRDEVTFLSSPLRRTRMTAERIAAGMGLENPEIPVSELLGNGTFYYDDPSQVLEVFRPENFFNACFEYFRTGEQKGFKNLHTASNQLEDWLRGHLARRLLLVTTHDCYIAAFLAAKTGAVFTCENWPRFLDGGALFLQPDGRTRYALVRTGLSTGICGVGGKVM